MTTWVWIPTWGTEAISITLVLRNEGITDGWSLPLTGSRITGQSCLNNKMERLRKSSDIVLLPTLTATPTPACVCAHLTYMPLHLGMSTHTHICIPQRHIHSKIHALTCICACILEYMCTHVHTTSTYKYTRVPTCKFGCMCRHTHIHIHIYLHAHMQSPHLYRYTWAPVYTHTLPMLKFQISVAKDVILQTGTSNSRTAVQQYHMETC